LARITTKNASSSSATTKFFEIIPAKKSKLEIGILRLIGYIHPTNSKKLFGCILNFLVTRVVPRIAASQHIKQILVYSAVFGIFLALSAFMNAAYCQTPVTTDSRIRTLVYNPNEVYELKFYYNYQSFIEFSEDEEIEMISIGEAFAWRLTPSGKRLFIRPLEISAHTNMTIITNKRIYHFDIQSDEYSGRADEDLVYTIRFFYPQIGQPLPIPPQLSVPNIATRNTRTPLEVLPQSSGGSGSGSGNNGSGVSGLGSGVIGGGLGSGSLRVIKTPIPKTKVDEDLPGIVDRNPSNAELNFDYRFAGSGKTTVPLKVYDDGSETHFQFANENKLVPIISSVDSFGLETKMSYTIRDRYVVIPGTATQFTLRNGNEITCIFNNKSMPVSVN